MPQKDTHYSLHESVPVHRSRSATAVLTKRATLQDVARFKVDRETSCLLRREF